MPDPGVTLALVNANVLTMAPSHPRAESVAVAGESIAAVGDSREIRRITSPRTQVIDCRGLTLLPGFNDAHCHLPGLARRLQDFDCGPQLAPSIETLLALLRQSASTRPSGSWVRGHGYDHLRMAEQRHPVRWELDAAAPEHPVWLEHRSGHAAALNSRALALADIRRETPDPPGGVIERDPATGEPTGMLLEMRPFLRQRLGRIRSPQDFDDGMRAAGQLLNSYGITSAQDAGADNGLERWRAFHRLQSTGAWPGRITMFAGAERLDELHDAGLSYGSSVGRLRLGHAKIMLTLTAGALHPSPPELARLVAGAHDRGFPVAIHCIEETVIAAALDALAASRRPAFPPPGEGSMAADRIEHCGEGVPHLVDAVRRAGATVVTQPGFIYHHGATYRDHVEARLLPHLYPTGSLHRAGGAVAFGSDAPVIDPNPWPALYAAVTRRAADGQPLAAGDAQAVATATALRMHTAAGAAAEGLAARKGVIAPGKLADMVLVDTNPLAAAPERLPDVRATLTVIGGTVVWGNI